MKTFPQATIFMTIIAISYFLISTYTDVQAQDLEILSKPKTTATPDCPCDEKKKKDPKAWDLSAAAGFNLASGNVDASLITGSFDAHKEKDNNIYDFVITGAEGKQDDERTQRYVRASVDYGRLLSKRAFVGINTSILSDQIADIDYRAIVSPDLGYYFIKNENSSLAIDTGPAHVFQKQGGIIDNYFAWRFSNDFSLKLSETAKIFQTTEVLLNTENTHDTLVLAAAGVEAALNSSVALVFQVQDRFDNLPAVGSKRNDVIITSALKFAF